MKILRKSKASLLYLLGYALLCFIALPCLCYSKTYPLPNRSGDLVGQIQHIRASAEDTLDDIAARYGVSLHELSEANPALSNGKQLRAGTSLVIPSRYILPPKKYRRGIVINLAELRLYYFPKHRPIVITYPVGLGRAGWRTPIMQAHVTHKKRYPTWYVPESVRQDYYEQTGVFLPPSVPPGRNNPLGDAALYLSTQGYLIHGNAAAYSIGKFISAGCIRLYNKDINALYRIVTVGTPVTVMNQSMKAGCVGNTCYLEAHRPVKLPAEFTRGSKHAGFQTDSPVRVIREAMMEFKVSSEKKKR